MMCYQITANDEPVALVATMTLAARIVQCQPPGYYDVDTIEVGDLIPIPVSMSIPIRKTRVRKFSIKPRRPRGRSRGVDSTDPRPEGRDGPMLDPAWPPSR